MTSINLYEPPFGGRVSSPKFRESVQRSEAFEGLEENLDRFYALKLVKQAGKELGFTAELIELLEYYLIRTDEIDWTEGSRPICYQAVLTTAQDLGISERQVRNREKALNERGALTWQDSGNFKRFGVRDRESRRIVYAFGVDLSPLASLIPALEQKLEEKKALRYAWNERKRKISGYRGRIRSLLAEASLHDELADFVMTVQAEYEAISYSIRTYHSLSDLQALLDKHHLMVQALFEVLETVSKAGDIILITCETSAKDEVDCLHIQCTNLSSSDKSDTSSPSGKSFQRSVAADTNPQTQDSSRGKDRQVSALPSSVIEDMGRITSKQLLWAASERFKERHMLYGRGLDLNEFVDTAFDLLKDLGIHKSAWWNACQILGRHGAAICVLIIDQKAQDPENPVKNPGGYLREMTARAKKGELKLHRSVFGLLKRGDEKHDA